MFARKLTLGVVALSVLAVGIAAPAHAATGAAPEAAAFTTTTEIPYSVESSAELDAYLSTLDADAASEFVESSLPATATVSTTTTADDATAVLSARTATLNGVAVSARATGCWTSRAQYDIFNSVGGKLYTFFQVGG